LCKLEMEKKYYITFTYNYIRYCYTYFLRSKDKALWLFKHYKNEVENQLNKKIKVIRSDRGGEYKALFDKLCSQNDIIHQITNPYSP
jgi:hypothetical protein